MNIFSSLETTSPEHGQLPSIEQYNAQQTNFKPYFQRQRKNNLNIEQTEDIRLQPTETRQEHAVVARRERSKAPPPEAQAVTTEAPQNHRPEREVVYKLPVKATELPAEQPKQSKINSKQRKIFLGLGGAALIVVALLAIGLWQQDNIKAAYGQLTQAPSNNNPGKQAISPTDTQLVMSFSEPLSDLDYQVYTLDFPARIILNLSDREGIAKLAVQDPGQLISNVAFNETIIENNSASTMTVYLSDSQLFFEEELSADRRQLRILLASTP